MINKLEINDIINDAIDLKLFMKYGSKTFTLLSKDAVRYIYTTPSNIQPSQKNSLPMEYDFDFSLITQQKLIDVSEKIVNSIERTIKQMKSFSEESSSVSKELIIDKFGRTTVDIIEATGKLRVNLDISIMLV